MAPTPETMQGVLASLVVAVGSVHRQVPPTSVTSGSEAGHSTLGYGSRRPPLATGCFVPLAVPLSPDAARTVTPLCAAEMKACRRVIRDWTLPKDPSAAAKLCEMTCARP